jgi:hypothetical protein
MVAGHKLERKTRKCSTHSPELGPNTRPNIRHSNTKHDARAALRRHAKSGSARTASNDLASACADAQQNECRVLQCRSVDESLQEHALAKHFQQLLYTCAA